MCCDSRALDAIREIRENVKIKIAHTKSFYYKVRRAFFPHASFPRVPSIPTVPSSHELKYEGAPFGGEHAERNATHRG